MTAMVSTRVRGSRGSGATALGCTVVLVSALLGGCSREIPGVVRAAPASATTTAAVPVADLLISPAEFPPRYPAVTVDPLQVDPVLRGVDGVVAGSVVTPADCTPPAPEPAPLYSAAAEGLDGDQVGSLIVSVTRSSFPLSARKDQLAACPRVTVTVGDARSTVTATLLAPPPVDADDTYAVDKTVTSATSDAVQRSLTLVAQIADVRVSATWLSSRAATPDSEAVDAVFTDAVLKVRRGGGS
jgi:hypothetical protein